MNKDDVYQIIGYHGEYTSNVKKAIRKLLKDNHPDNKGDRDKFELINEVKDELENNKVPSKYQKRTVTKEKIVDDIDYAYCHELINSLTRKQKEYKDISDKYNKELSKLEEEYRNIYRKSMDLELNLLSSSDEAKRIQSIKAFSIIMVIIIAITFIISIIKHNIFLLIVFVLLAIVCIIVIEKYFSLVSDMTKNNKNRLKEYVLINKSIRDNTRKQEELHGKLLDISKKLNNVENDLRFYNNLLK